MRRWIHLRGTGQAGLLARGELDVDLARDGRREFILQGEHVARIGLEALRPKMPIGPGIDQLRGDANLVAGAEDRAFDHGIDVESVGNLRCRRPLFTLELHGRTARDDAQLADGGEIGG